MRRLGFVILFGFFWASLATTLQGIEAVELQMRLYLGVKKGTPEPVGEKAAFKFKKIADEYILPDFEFSKELQTIMKIYNLEYAHFQYKVNMVFKKGKQDMKIQEVHLSRWSMKLQLSNVEGKEDRFEIEMLPINGDSEPLLKTEIIVPEERTAVLGFKDTAGRVYFLALNRKQDRDYREQNGTPESVQAPKLIKRSVPPYPEGARVKKIEGVVILEGHTDSRGVVSKIFVIKGEPELIDVSKKSIALWMYSPWRINGVPEPVRFHLMIVYRLKVGSSLKEAEGVKSLDALFEKYRPVMKQWRFQPDVSKENKAIAEVIIVEG